MTTNQTEYARQRRAANGPDRSAKPITKARGRAVSWLKVHRPDVWEGLVNDAYAELGLERQQVGRRRNT